MRLRASAAFLIVVAATNENEIGVARDLPLERSERGILTALERVGR